MKNHIRTGWIALLSFLILINSLPVNAAKNITIFAASSLTSSFSEVQERLIKLNPNIKVRFIFGPSSTLATQIQNGAKVDIFVSASESDMNKITKGENYLINRVVLGVAKNSRIMDFSDLNTDLKWIRCADHVPCGAAAKRALIFESITSEPVSLEPMSSSVLAKLLANEVDAAIIYNTDFIANAGKLRKVEFSNRASSITQYKIARLVQSKDVTVVYNFIKSKSVLDLLVKKGFELK